MNPNRRLTRLRRSKTSPKKFIAELGKIDKLFKDKPEIENSQFAEHYIIRRREAISKILNLSFSNCSPLLIEELSNALQKSHYKRDYSTELIVEFLRNKKCRIRLESLLGTLTRTAKTAGDLNEVLTHLNDELLSPINIAVRGVRLREIGYPQVVSLWERVIALETSLSTEKGRLDHALTSLRSELATSKQDLEKFKEAYVYGKEFAELMETIYEMKFLDVAKDRYQEIWDSAKSLRGELQEILDYVSARATARIQRETTLLNVLFLAAAVAECVALTQTDLGLWGLLPVVSILTVFLLVRLIIQRDS